jgi:hypothetical protein
MSEYQHHSHMALGDGVRDLTGDEVDLVSGGVIAPIKPDRGYEPKMVSDGLPHLKY